MNSYKVEGNGILFRNEKILKRGSFSFHWDILKLNNPKEMYLEFLVPGFHPMIFQRKFDNSTFSLKGNTSKGKAILVEKLIPINLHFEHKNRKTKSTLGFFANKVIIGEKSILFEKIEFYYVNVKFGYMNNEKHPKGINKPVKTSLNVDGIRYVIKIEDVSNHTIQENKFFDQITMKITIFSPRYSIKRVQAEYLVQIISEIFTVAYGDLIGWSLQIGYDNGKESYREYRNIYKCSNNVFRKLIPIRFSENLLQLLKTSFESYYKLSEQKRETIMKLIQGIQLSASKFSFPLPIIMLASTIEGFADKVLDNKSNSLVTKKQRKTLRTSFKSWIEEEVFPFIEEQNTRDWFIKNANQKLSSMLQKTLRERIISLLDKYSIEFEESIIRKFVKRRNNAMHSDYSYKKSDYEIWCKLAALFEQIVLKKIGYKGQFNDWYEVVPKEKEFINPN